MCIMCIEIMKGKITIKESIQGMYEMIRTTDDEEMRKHYMEIYYRLVQDLKDE